MIYKFTLESFLVGKITCLFVHRRRQKVSLHCVMQSQSTPCFNGYIIYEQLLGDNAAYLRQNQSKMNVKYNS